MLCFPLAVLRASELFASLVRLKPEDESLPGPLQPEHCLQAQIRQPGPGHCGPGDCGYPPGPSAGGSDKSGRVSAHHEEG